jgi:broad specificity polyphosphatase/5'/3'-nucleotidase SurE
MKIIKRVIQRILNSYDYYKVNLPEGGKLTEAEVMELYKTYGENKTYRRHLRDLCENDKELYYIARDDRERDMIRGAERRTKYLLSLVNKSNSKASRDKAKENRSNNKLSSSKVNYISGVDYARERS